MSDPFSVRYRPMNWSSHNALLRKRESLLIWIETDMTWRAA